MRAVIQTASAQTTTTPPVVVWAPIRAAEDLRDTR
jgi:hypothetical protein